MSYMNVPRPGANGEEPPGAVWGGSYRSTYYYLHFHLKENKMEKEKKEKDAPYDSVLSYIWKREKDYYEDKYCFGTTLEAKLTTIYALYMAAWAVGEITWDQAFYAYADFTAKLLKIR